MSTQQLLQMSAVCTDRFSVTDFATFSKIGTIIKHNLQKINQKQVVSIGASVTVHNTV